MLFGTFLPTSQKVTCLCLYVWRHSTSRYTRRNQNNLESQYRTLKTFCGFIARKQIVNVERTEVKQSTYIVDSKNKVCGWCPFSAAAKSTVLYFDFWTDRIQHGELAWSSIPTWLSKQEQKKAIFDSVLTCGFSRFRTEFYCRITTKFCSF